MLNFCPLTGWWFLLLCPQSPLQLNSNFHSIPWTSRFPTFPSTDALIPYTSRCEMQVSHDLWLEFVSISQRKNILWEWRWDSARAFLFPANGAAAGWKPAKRAQGGAESFLGAVPLPSLLLGLKVGRKRGEISPTWGFSCSPATLTPAPLPEWQQLPTVLSTSPWTPASFLWPAPHLLRRVKLQPTYTYFINNNKSNLMYSYWGVMFANKTEKTALGWMDLIATHRFWNPSHAAHILMRSPRCLPSPWLLELLRLNHVLGTTSQAVACRSPAPQRLCGPCLVPAGDAEAAAGPFKTHTHKPCFPH